MKDHEAIKSCMADNTVDDAACFFENHLVCKEDGCSHKDIKPYKFRLREEPHKAVEE